ncbi:MAG: radical SAM protein [Planctomycetota bacterium]
MAVVSFVEPQASFNAYKIFRLPLLGSLQLGTILKGRGHDVKVFSESLKTIYHPRKGLLDKRLEKSDVVGISIMTSTARRGYEIADVIRKRNPKTRIIIGGSHASARPEEALKHADLVVCGEGESAIKDAVEGNSTGIVRGERVADLDSLPTLDFSLLKNFVRGPLNLMPIATSRGCPFDCTFCSVTKMFGRRYRFRSPELVLTELVRRVKEGERVFFVYDDNFAADKDRTRQLMEGMLSKRLKKIKWAVQARVDIGRDGELLDLMARAGCTTVLLGMESVNSQTLNTYNKRQSIQDIVRCINNLHKRRIKVHGMFVLGSDNDTPQTIRDTLRFCKRMKIGYAQFSVLTPLPGTQLYDQLEAEKRIWTKNWTLYDGTHVVFFPQSFSVTQLQYWVEWAWKRFYDIHSPLKFLVSRYLLKRWEQVNKSFLCHLPRVRKPRHLLESREPDGAVEMSESATQGA